LSEKLADVRKRVRKLEMPKKVIGEAGDNIKRLEMDSYTEETRR